MTPAFMSVGVAFSGETRMSRNVARFSGSGVLEAVCSLSETVASGIPKENIGPAALDDTSHGAGGTKDLSGMGVTPE